MGAFRALRLNPPQVGSSITALTALTHHTPGVRIPNASRRHSGSCYGLGRPAPSIQASVAFALIDAAAMANSRCQSLKPKI